MQDWIKSQFKKGGNFHNSFSLYKYSFFQFVIFNKKENLPPATTNHMMKILSISCLGKPLLAGCPSTLSGLVQIFKLRKLLIFELHKKEKEVRKHFAVFDKITRKLLFYDIISISHSVFISNIQKDK